MPRIAGERPILTGGRESPFVPGCLAELRIESGAVCTSGNYVRHTEIAGKRYGYIVDWRIGWPPDARDDGLGYVAPVRGAARCPKSLLIYSDILI